MATDQPTEAPSAVERISGADILAELHEDHDDCSEHCRVLVALAEIDALTAERDDAMAALQEAARREAALREAIERVADEAVGVGYGGTTLRYTISASAWGNLLDLAAPGRSDLEVTP